MAWENPTLIPGMKAGADYTAVGNQYKLVKLSADGTVVLCTAVTDTVIGVLCNRPNSGETADVGMGICKVQGDVDLTAGDIISPSADAQAAIAATTSHPCGVVLVGNATAAGLATCFVVPGITIKV